MKTPTPSELQIHIAIVHRLRLQGNPAVAYWHTPNGEYRSPRVAQKLKAMGVLPGVADLAFLWAVNGQPRLLFLELKRKGGRLSDEQIAFRWHCQQINVPWHVADSVDEAVLILQHFGILPVEGQSWPRTPTDEVLA